MNNPTVTEGVGFINFHWQELKLRVVAERVTDEGSAELSFYSGDLLLHITRVNLMSTTTMNSLAKRLEKNSKDKPWTDILTYITGKTMEIVRRGEPAVEIWPSDEILKPEYMIYPLLPLNQPAIIFGDGGAGKGNIALTLAIIAQLPLVDNKLGLITRDEPSPVLYIDYENDEREFTRVFSGICKGLGVNVGLQRLEAKQPISDMIDQLQQRVDTIGCRFIIIDSLALASGGNINEAEPAIRLYAALRKLPGLTTLIIAHNAKDPLLKTKSVYGSVFFTNLARSVWEVKKSQTPDEPEMFVSLKHVKSNRKLHLPLGFHLAFDDENNIITIEKADLKGTELSTELPKYLQMKHVLLEEGKMLPEKLANIMDMPLKSTKALLYKYKTIFINLDDGSWGVVSERGSY